MNNIIGNHSNRLYAQMNPILLKSGGRRESDGAFLCSVFVLGKLLATEDFGALGERSMSLLELVVDAFGKLVDHKQGNDRDDQESSTVTIVIEGAGSCTELNLMKRDVVNMPLVRRLNSPWILVANIDPGGVFAQIVGTKACLPKEDWDLCVGVVVNKLRGEAKYFEPGPQMLQEMVGKPIFVIPFLYDIGIAEEDGMGLQHKLNKEHLLDNVRSKGVDENVNPKSRIVVICYPHISMTDDMLPLEQDGRFEVEWRRNHLPANPPSAIILPGSRQTRLDLEWLAESPWRQYLANFASLKQGIILGICGGYQMLGRHVDDELGVESGKFGRTAGLGLLDVATTLEPAKIVKKIETATIYNRGVDITVQGFEIHSGQTTVVQDVSEPKGSPLLCFPDERLEGWKAGMIAGTYLHGLLESRPFRSWLFLKDNDNNYREDGKQQDSDPLDRLAAHLVSHGLNYATLSKMMSI